MIDTFIDKLNKELIPKIDFERLGRAYDTKEKTYAKETLKAMHDLVVEIMGTDYIDHDFDYILVPAVIIGSKTNKICIGLVGLDIESSGEHCETFFFTKNGVFHQGDNEGIKKEHIEFISENYMPYNYYYTIFIETDHHVDFDNVPSEIVEMLNFANPGDPELLDLLER